jgi:hypothetical protein
VTDRHEPSAEDLADRLRRHVQERGGPTIENGVWQLMLDAADALDAVPSRAPVGEDAERIVACALAEYAGKDPDKPHVGRAGQTLPYPEWRRWLGEAKAAIAAMPPPPEREALRRGLAQCGEYLGDTNWNPMIRMAAAAIKRVLLGETTP